MFAEIAGKDTVFLMECTSFLKHPEKFSKQQEQKITETTSFTSMEVVR